MEGGKKMKGVENMEDLQLEIAKTQASLNNLIIAVRMHEEGKADVDVLGSLLALSDQIEKMDLIIDSKF